MQGLTFAWACSYLEGGVPTPCQVRGCRLLGGITFDDWHVHVKSGGEHRFYRVLMNLSSLVQTKTGTELTFGTTSGISILPGVLPVYPQLLIATLALSRCTARLDGAHLGQGS